MSFKGATINKLNGGLGRTSETDRVICLIGGMTLVGDLAYNTAEELLDISTVEDLGITASTDDTNAELMHYHLSEMFRLAPESTFYLIPVDKTKSIADLVADDALKAAIRSIDGINVLGISGLSTLVADGLTEAIALQGLVSAFESEHLLIDGIFVEGVGGALPIAVADYPDLRSITAPNISYVIAQDPAVAALNAAYAKRAAIGTVLGSVAVRKVHEDIGSVDIEVKPRTRRGEENYSLSSELLGYWLSAALSDGTGFKTLSEAEQTSLTSKGWMYVGSFAEYPGFYLNGCPTAVDKSSDYAYFNNNCIWNKAARIIRKTLIPRVRSKVPTDPTTGQLKSTWVSGAEQSVMNALDPMESAGNIDGKDVYINPVQAISETTPLRVKAQVVVGKIVHEFDVDLGLTDKI
ncbi:DUF2586 family protein [Carboxylicivirga linearis]|uniref:DUF2586 family protein n=1 Tax=Carboxylicivirga linearis TaxID=1628157 RepID=A0ABS5JWA2_9BACT|nr:DUF2586 family protein [Carboxylicivirga linearis]MBS2099186.1 hypothetical protein [Carboxylicivirga linearis]